MEGEEREQRRPGGAGTKAQPQGQDRGQQEHQGQIRPVGLSLLRSAQGAAEQELPHVGALPPGQGQDPPGRLRLAEAPLPGKEGRFPAVLLPGLLVHPGVDPRGILPEQPVQLAAGLQQRGKAPLLQPRQGAEHLLRFLRPLPQPEDEGIPQGVRQEAELPLLQREEALEAREERAQPLRPRLPRAGAHQGRGRGAEKRRALRETPQPFLPPEGQGGGPGAPAQDVPVVQEPLQRPRSGKGSPFTELLQLRLGLQEAAGLRLRRAPALQGHPAGRAFAVVGQFFRFDPQFQFILFHGLARIPRFFRLHSRKAGDPS